jgi:molybdopterin-binding protein
MGQSRIEIHTRSRSMKLSARNVLQGKIVEVTKGQTTAHVVIEIASGALVTASITNEAVDDLKLQAGSQAYAVIKASDVMIGVD